MSGLVRADWLRLRRRWDVWVITIGVPVLAILGYVNGARATNGMMGDPNGNVVACGDPAGYEFPKSLQTAAEAGAFWHLLGFAFLAATLLGSEFDWGTIRNTALIRPDRMRYLFVRFSWLLSLAAVSFVAVTLVGAVGPVIAAPAYPSCGGPQASIEVGGALAIVAALFVLSLAAIALCAAMALVFRSAASGVLGASLFAFGDMFISNFIISNLTGPVTYLPQLSFTTRLLAFMTDVGTAVQGGADVGGPASRAGWVALPPLVGATILACWLVGLFGFAFWRIRTLDIHE